MKLHTISLSSVNDLKIHGRTKRSLSPTTLFWTGSGVECNIKAAELWIEVDVSYDNSEPWISILVNGAWIGRQMLVKGRYWICIFRGMDKYSVRNIRIVKDSQALSWDEGNCLQIHAFRTDGEFVPIEDKILRIEFIGDSITCGEGAIGSKLELDWNPMWCSAQNNYSTMTSDALKADFRIIAQSGWGVLNGWDNNPNSALPKHYDKICGVVNGDRNVELGAWEANDFSEWQPDFIVINLGTNDGESFNTPAWVEAGKICKQRMNEDGSFNQEDLGCFENAVIAFLKKLRSYNPKAHLLWAYGMMGNSMLPSIEKAIDQYKAQSTDQKVSILPLPTMEQQDIGAKRHPGVKVHEKATKILVEALQGILNEHIMPY